MRFGALILAGFLAAGCGTDTPSQCEFGVCDDIKVDPDDADGDGLRDVDEARVGADPTKSDTDGDGRLDGTEVALGLNPAVSDAACIVDTYSADLRTKPVDVIFVIDNSSSMRDEIESVERNINENFTSIMTAAGLDFRVVMISKHGAGEEIDAEVCVEAPLSSTSCDPVPDSPANASRFFQYDTKISSDDSFSKILSTYGGWSSWLREDAFKVFVEITDDSPSMDALEFDRRLLELTPPRFGSSGNRSYIWHSIVGMLPKDGAPEEPYGPDEALVSFQCGTSESPGIAYQKLSVVTGGLRYPVCGYAGYDAVFRAAALKTIEDATIDCSLRLPSAPTGKLDSARIALELTDDTGRTRVVTKVDGPASCGNASGFYLTESTVELCPATCAVATSVEKGDLDVVAMCLPIRCENPSIEICDDDIDNDCDGFADRRDIKCYN